MKKQRIFVIILFFILIGFSTQKISAKTIDEYKEEKQQIQTRIETTKSTLKQLKKNMEITKQNLEEKQTNLLYTQKIYKSTLKKIELQYCMERQEDNLNALNFILADNHQLDLIRYIYLHNGDTIRSLQVQKNKITELKDKIEDKQIVLEKKVKQKTEVLSTLYVEKINIKKKIQKESDRIKKEQKRKKEAEEMKQKQLTRQGFNSKNLLQISGVSEEQLYKALEGKALYELAPVYVEAEKTYGVNALFLVALSAHESGWGSSPRAINDNNLTGFGVYNKNAEGINAPSKKENILQTTRWIKEKYLTDGASYFTGYGVKNVNVYYCLDENGKTDYEWSKSIISIAKGLLWKIN